MRCTSSTRRPQHLMHVVSLRELLSADRAIPVIDVGDRRPPLSVRPAADREDVARIIAKYNLLALPVVDDDGHMLGIVTVDDVIDAIVREQTEDVQKFGGVEALDAPYMEISFGRMLRKRAGWLMALFLSEMLTATAMQRFQGEIERAAVLALFIPLVMSSGGNSGSQATSLIIRALALKELKLGDWWRIALRELPTGLTLGAILGVIGFIRIELWQQLGFFNYGPHHLLVATTVGVCAGRHRGVRLVRRIDAAIPAPAARVRSGQCLCAVCRDVGRCHRAGDLFQRRVPHSSWDVAMITRAANASTRIGGRHASGSCAGVVGLGVVECPVLCDALRGAIRPLTALIARSFEQRRCSRPCRCRALESPSYTAAMRCCFAGMGWPIARTSGRPLRRRCMKSRRSLKQVTPFGHHAARGARERSASTTTTAGTSRNTRRTH